MLVVLCAASGRAQQSSVRIDYSAPAGCPTEANFLQEVLGRTQRAHLAGPSELAQTLKITVESQPGQSVARLEFVDTDSRRVRREVSGEDCAEVVSGIALVTALAIDARAKKQAPRAPAASVSLPPPTPPSPPPPAEVGPVVGSRTEPDRAGIRWDVGLGFLTTSAVAPSWLYGLDAFVALGPRDADWSARLTLAYLESPNLKIDRGEARFHLSFARLEGCPVALRPVAHLAFAPCAAFDTGIVAASGGGERVRDHKTVHVFWTAASLLVRMQLDLQDFLLFEAQGEFGTPLTREHFVFRESERLRAPDRGCSLGHRNGRGRPFLGSRPRGRFFRDQDRHPPGIRIRCRVSP